jgi:hypothetical protein
LRALDVEGLLGSVGSGIERIEVMSDSFSFPLDWLFLVLIVGGLSVFVVLVIVSVVRRFLGDRWRRGSKHNLVIENRFFGFAHASVLRVSVLRAYRLKRARARVREVV